MSLTQRTWTHHRPAGDNPEARAHVEEQAALAAAEAANQLVAWWGTLEDATRWAKAWDVLTEAVIELGPDTGATVTSCVDCDTVEDVTRMHEGHDGLLRCPPCDEEEHCACCQAIDAGDMDLAYILATDGMTDEEAADFGIEIPREDAA